MKIGKIFAVTVLQTFLLSMLLYFTLRFPFAELANAGAIGIIGGADGPTALFVAYDGVYTAFLTVFIIFIVSFITNMCSLFTNKVYSRIALVLGSICLLCFWILPFMLHKTSAIITAIIALLVFWGGYVVSSKYIR